MQREQALLLRRPHRIGTPPDEMDDVSVRRERQFAALGYEPDDLKIMPALCPVVGRTRAEAQAKYDQLQALIDPLAGLGVKAPKSDVRLTA